MKVIAKTALGYLVEASETELNAIAGDRYGSKVPWRQPHDRNSGVPIGTELSPCARFDAVYAIEQAEDRVRQGAAALRALADLAEKSMPSAIVPPPAPEPENA